MGTQAGETTLDLDQIMDEGMARFQGELEEAAREDLSSEQGARSSEEKAITPDSDGADDSPPGVSAEVGSRKSEVGDERPKTEKEGAEPKEGEAPLNAEGGKRSAEGSAQSAEEEKPRFRFKDHTEAEEGYRHLQAAKTRAEQEAARLRAELKTAQDAEQQRKEQEERDRNLVDFMAEQHEQALDKIDELDPDAEDYRKRVARVWAEKDAAIEVKRRELEAGSAELGTRNAEGGAGSAEDPAAAWAMAEEAARNAKIDPEDDYFRMICTYAPSQGPDGQALSFDDQVQWAIEATREYHKKQEQRFQERLKKEAERQSEAHQEKSLPLGRSPADRSAGKPPAPKVVTLNDALEDAMEERRL